MLKTVKSHNGIVQIDQKNTFYGVSVEDQDQSSDQDQDCKQDIYSLRLPMSRGP